MNKERLQWIIEWLDWDRLSTWEENFVVSAEEYFKRYGRLSEKQEEILERIHREKSIDGPRSGKRWYE